MGSFISYSSWKVNDEYCYTWHVMLAVHARIWRGKNVKTTWRQFIACHRGIQESLCNRVRLTAGIHNCLWPGALHIAAGRENTVEYFPWMHCGGGGGRDEWLTMPSQQVFADERFNIFFIICPWRSCEVDLILLLFQSFYYLSDFSTNCCPIPCFCIHRFAFAINVPQI